MPCSSEYSYDENKERLKRIEDKLDIVDTDKRKLQEELDQVTDFLCQILRENPKLALKNLNLNSWWQKHQEWDKKNNR